MRTKFTTPKGTDLPLLNLKGKEYLQVQHRLVWMREEHADWSISTSYVSVNEKEAFARAEIRDGEGKLLATAHKTETAAGFPDYIEKAETGSIGRALAYCGYGTQFCADELDEGKRLADSPSPPPSGLPNFVENDQTDLGEFIVSFGKKYLGKRLKEISEDDVYGYVTALEEDARKKGKPVSQEVVNLRQAAKMYYATQRAQ